MPRSRSARVAATFVLTWTGFTSGARAGNDEGHLLGNQAAMTGGAVTATVSEGSSIWYNPAGLAQVTSQSLDLSANLYGFRIQSAPRLLSTDDGRADAVRITEFVTVPTAATYVRPIASNLSLGFGLFVPRESDLILRGDLTNGAERWLLTVASYERVTYGGASLGWGVTESFRFGVSLLSYLGFQQEESQFAGGTPGYGSASFISTSRVSTTTTFGGMTALGIQWDVSESWKVGLSLRSPELNFYSLEKSSSVVTAAIPNGTGQYTAFGPDTTTTQNTSSTLTRPIQLRWGVARAWPGGWLALDGDVSPALHQATVPQRAKYNVRLGGVQSLGEKVRVGGGVFTDRDSRGGDSDSAANALDFVGGSAGVSWRSSYVVDDADSHRKFDFETVLALRYAYARGEISALRVRGVEELGGSGFDDTTPLTVHELAIHVGSAFYF